jgi:hypothetical protein
MGVLDAALGRDRRGRYRIAPVADGVRGALPWIDQLAALLRDPATPTPVIAAAAHLLADGTGPVYNPRAPVDLDGELRRLVTSPGPRSGRDAAGGP